MAQGYLLVFSLFFKVITVGGNVCILNICFIWSCFALLVLVYSLSTKKLLIKNNYECNRKRKPGHLKMTRNEEGPNNL